MRKRAAETETTEMGRMGAEAASSSPQCPPEAETFIRKLRVLETRPRVEDLIHAFRDSIHDRFVLLHNRPEPRPGLVERFLRGLLHDEARVLARHAALPEGEQQPLG